MKLTELLLTILIIGLLAAMLGPRVAAARAKILSTWAAVTCSHNERIDWLASGAMEDPVGHHTTERDTQDTLTHYGSLRFDRK
jgi:type II secretory pathway pseudopilin PulG